jgi:hypothetical protein
MVPIAAFAAAKLSNGTLTGRYLISMVLGVAIAGSSMLRFLPRKTPVVLALTAFVLAAVGRQETVFWTGKHGNATGASPAESLSALWSSAGQPDVPIVISSGLTFLQTAYYAPPALGRQLSAIVDAPNAIKYSGSDSLDRQMIVLPCCLDIQVHQFPSFAREDSTFLMYSDANFDWCPVRLRKEGYTLEVVGSDKDHDLYRVHRSGALP